MAWIDETLLSPAVWENSRNTSAGCAALATEIRGSARLLVAGCHDMMLRQPGTSVVQSKLKVEASPNLLHN